MGSSRKSRQPIQSVQVTMPELPVPNFKLYPYEAQWVNDRARLKIACKSRRIGHSFASGLRALCSCLQWKHNVIILSKKEELAKEFISEVVAPHVRDIGILASYHQGYRSDEVRRSWDGCRAELAQPDLIVAMSPSGFPLA
jgi:hypothetical protein